MKTENLSSEPVTANSVNTVLSAGIISQIADQYEKEVEIEKQFQEEKRKQIKELEQLIISSLHKPIYKLLYKEEYGDYREYSESVAKELRRRNACR